MTSNLTFSFKKLLLLFLTLIVSNSFTGESLLAAPLCSQLLLKTQDASLQFFEAKDNDPATILISDSTNSRFFSKGTVTTVGGRNFLQLVLILRHPDGQRSSLSGTESVQKIIKGFEAKGIRIDAFQAHWNDHLREFGGPSDNFIQFLKSYKKNLLHDVGTTELPTSINKLNVPAEIEQPLLRASIQAANATWSGRVMNTLGFTHVEAVIFQYTKGISRFDGKDGSIDIQVVWSKSPVNAAIKFYHDRSEYGSFMGSMLPRLHQMLEKITD